MLSPSKNSLLSLIIIKEKANKKGTGGKY